MSGVVVDFKEERDATVGLGKEMEGVRVPPRPSRMVVELEERRADAKAGRGVVRNALCDA